MTGATTGAIADGLVLHSAKGRIALVATVAASGMAMFDATVVNVALPHIGDDFDASVSALQWVLTGYLLALASLILLGGALGDRFGRRKVFVIGTVWFAAASLLCGAAPNIEVLVAARVLQGVGAALLTPGSLAILQASFRERDRAARRRRVVGARRRRRARSARSSGGWLVDGPGWRWAFLINLPVAAIVVVCACTRPCPRPATRTPHGPRPRRCGARRRQPRRQHVGAHRGRPRGWTDAAVLGAGVDRRRRHRRLRLAHAAHAAIRSCRPRCSAAATFTVDQPGDRAAVRRARRVVLPRRLRAAGRAPGWSALEGGHRPAAGDGADARCSRRARARSPSGSGRGCSSPSARCSPRAGLLLLAASVPTRRG